MDTRIAAVVTIDDLKNYFTGEDWKVEYASPSTLEVKSRYYNVELKSKSFMYHVHIEATEDPMDSDDKVTDEPLEFLVNFLSTGTEGDAHFEKMSSGPEKFASSLVVIASSVEKGRLSIPELSRILRRSIISTDSKFFFSTFRTLTRYAAREDIQREELEDLKKSMLTKGWKVKESETDAGLPELSIDISGIYHATISIDNIAWSYSYEVHGIDDSKEEGVTDDPIVQFRNYYRKPETQNAKAEFRARVENTTPAPGLPTHPTNPPSGYEKTVPPPRKSPPA